MKYCNSAVNDVFRPLPESMTICATVDESGDEQVITEMMIRRACEQMDDCQVWPFDNAQPAETFQTLPPLTTAKIIPFRRKAS